MGRRVGEPSSAYGSSQKISSNGYKSIRSKNTALGGSKNDEWHPMDRNHSPESQKQLHSVVSTTDISDASRQDDISSQATNLRPMRPAKLTA